MNEDREHPQTPLDDDTVSDPVPADGGELTDDDLDEVAGGWDDTTGTGGG